VQTAKSRKKYEIIAEAIKQQINQGVLKPGDQLESVERLAVVYQTGRSAVREAISELRALGLVEVKQGDGTFVRAAGLGLVHLPIYESERNDKPEKLAFFELRRVLETGTVALAAGRRTETDLIELRQALADMAEATDSGDEGQAVAADSRFHLAVAVASHNHLMVKLMTQISETLRYSMQESRMLWLFAEQSTMERLYQEHVSIYEAIEEGNAALAEQLMLSHLSKVEKRMLEQR
jgi:GntR family transcriptional repressor for pyruvate dehydrogenase complex